MKKIIFSAWLIIPFSTFCQVKQTPVKAKPLKTNQAKTTQALKSSLDSFSYAIGINVASNLKDQGISELNNALVLRAFNDVYDGKSSLLDLVTANKLVAKQFDSIAAQKLDAERLSGLKFLSANKKRPEVKVTASGLQYEILKAGTGDIATDTSTVTLHYTVSLLNGQKIDSSAKTGGPITVRVNELIPGWAEAVKLMPAGSKWKIYIPFYLAFGERTPPPTVPPGASLIYEVELAEVVKAP